MNQSQKTPSEMTNAINTAVDVCSNAGCFKASRKPRKTSKAGTRVISKNALQTMSETLAHSRRSSKPTPVAMPQAPNAISTEKRTYRKNGGVLAGSGKGTRRAMARNAANTFAPLKIRTMSAEAVIKERFIATKYTTGHPKRRTCMDSARPPQIPSACETGFSSTEGPSTPPAEKATSQALKTSNGVRASYLPSSAVYRFGNEAKLADAPHDNVIFLFCRSNCLWRADSEHNETEYFKCCCQLERVDSGERRPPRPVSQHMF
jgi:hypothetical protein